jgi:hypothetical protein
MDNTSRSSGMGLQSNKVSSLGPNNRVNVKSNLQGSNSNLINRESSIGLRSDSTKLSQVTKIVKQNDRFSLNSHSGGGNGVPQMTLYPVPSI